MINAEKFESYELAFDVASQRGEPVNAVVGVTAMACYPSGAFVPLSRPLCRIVTDWTQPN